MTNSEPENNQDPSATEQSAAQSDEYQPDRYDPRYYTDPGRDELGDLLRGSLIGDLPPGYELPYGYDPLQRTRFPERYNRQALGRVMRPEPHDWQPTFERRPDLSAGYGAFQRLVDNIGPDNKPIVIDPTLLQRTLDNIDDTTILRNKASAVANMSLVLNRGTVANPNWPRITLDRVLDEYRNPEHPLEPNPEERP